MRCEEVLKLVAAGGPRRDESSIDAHLEICPSCRLRVPAADTLGMLLRDPLLWEEPSPEMEDRVMSALFADAPVPVHPNRRLLAVTAALILSIVVLLTMIDRPDWKVELVAGPDGPEATATVRGWNEGAGTRMMFDVAGLEELDEGFYEIWMTAADGTHVSAGSFTSPGRIEVNVGVHRADFPRIWVTVEASDGDPNPTPHTVLDTPIGEV